MKWTNYSWLLSEVFHSASSEKTSLYLIGRQGHSHLSLAVDVMDVVLSVSEDNSVMLGDDSESESGELTEDDKLNDEGHDEGEERL